MNEKLKYVKAFLLSNVFFFFIIIIGCSGTQDSSDVVVNKSYTDIDKTKRNKETIINENEKKLNKITKNETKHDTWIELISTFGDYHLHSIESYKNSGVVFLGSISNNVELGFITLDKLNNSGIFEWEKTTQIPGRTEYNIIQTKDEGFILVGSSDESKNGDIWLMKMDSFGETIWNNIYKGCNDEFANDIIEASDGNIYIIGNTETFTYGNKIDCINEGAPQVKRINSDIFVIKVDLMGSIIWQKRFGSKNIDIGRSVIETLDNGVLIVGNSLPYDDQERYDLEIIKLDYAGNIQWQKVIKNLKVTNLYGDTKTCNGNDGELYIAYQNKNDMISILKLNENGKIIYNKTIKGIKSNSKFLIDSILKVDNGIILTGSTNELNNEQKQNNIGMFILQFDNNGNLEWERGYKYKRGSCVVRDSIISNNSYIISGGDCWDELKTYSNKIFIARLNKNGMVKEPTGFLSFEPGISVFESKVKIGNQNFEYDNTNFIKSNSNINLTNSVNKLIKISGSE